MELIVAMVIMTVAVLAGVGSFRVITQAIRGTRTRTIAANLGQEKMESLKNYNYFTLTVTTQTGTDTNFTPNVVYDSTNYAPETITLWGLPTLTRRVYVAYAEMNGVVITTVPSSTNDTGLKEVFVYVTWREDAGDYKKFEVRNLFANPSASTLDATISGTVTKNVAGNPAMEGALVEVVGSPNWKDTTDSAGNYSFQVAHGIYTVRASSAGYTTEFSSSRSVVRAENEDVDFSLSEIATGTISGTVWISTNLLISHVVASSGTVGGVEQEYIELFNPTTSVWTMATAGVANYDIMYDEKDGGTALSALALTYTNATSTIGPKNFYLIASVNPVTIDGNTRVPDAVYNCNAAMIALYPTCPAIIEDDTTGGIGIRQVADTNYWPDRVAWKKGGIQSSPEALTEGTAVETGGTGLNDNEYLIRKISTESTPSLAEWGSIGNAYDTNDNNNDVLLSWVVATGLPRTSIRSVPTISGTPAIGAFVTATDPTSPSTKAVTMTGTNGSTYAQFNLVGVGTGTWRVSVVSGTYISEYTNVTSSQGVTTLLPNSVSASSWNVAGFNAAILTSSSSGGIVEGYVYGSGTEYNTPLNNILMEAGGRSARTDVRGAYVMSLPEGAVTVHANFNRENASYITASEAGTVVNGGVVSIAANPYFHLSKGGTLKGYVSSGTAALPNTTIRATLNNAVHTSVSDHTGYFYIQVSTSASAYTVVPELENTQSYTSTPDPIPDANRTVDDPGETVFVGTFTVIGGVGYITGTVKEGSEAITTGVLIIASTGTISDPPPIIYGSSAPAMARAFYTVSSQADGTYTVALPAGSYDMSAYYPKVATEFQTVTTTRKTKSSVSVTAGATTSGQNFLW